MLLSDRSDQKVRTQRAATREEMLSVRSSDPSEDRTFRNNLRSAFTLLKRKICTTPKKHPTALDLHAIAFRPVFRLFREYSACSAVINQRNKSGTKPNQNRNENETISQPLPRQRSQVKQKRHKSESNPKRNRNVSETMARNLQKSLQIVQNVSPKNRLTSCCILPIFDWRIFRSIISLFWKPFVGFMGFWIQTKELYAAG